jgi:3-isopropylmalate/(R)-2-methylmalate dehydratase large subunit
LRSTATSPGVYAKDVVLHIIRTLGVKGGVGYAYEFAGSAIDAMSMEERMTLCNMSIEGGRSLRLRQPRPPSPTTICRGRDFAPKGERLGTGGGLVGTPSAAMPMPVYDDVVVLRCR